MMDYDPTPTPSPYLQSFISKTLRITTTDTRVFIGELKCTDKAKNLILSQTHEYRYPSAHELASTVAGAPAAGVAAAETAEDKVKLALKSRYIGLVVVPGEYIVKVEVEDGPGGRPAGRF